MARIVLSVSAKKGCLVLKGKGMSSKQKKPMTLFPGDTVRVKVETDIAYAPEYFVDIKFSLNKATVDLEQTVDVDAERTVDVKQGMCDLVKSNIQ